MVCATCANNVAQELGFVVIFAVFGWECIAIQDKSRSLPEMKTKIIDSSSSKCHSIAMCGRLWNLSEQNALICVVFALKRNYCRTMHSSVLAETERLSSCLQRSKDAFGNLLTGDHGGSVLVPF